MPVASGQMIAVNGEEISFALANVSFKVGGNAGFVAGLGLSNVITMKGGMGKKQRQAITDLLAAIPNEAPRVIIATGSFIGEGFDDSRLDTLFLTMPISWQGTLQQYVGRLHRLHEGKKTVRVYDYADTQVTA